MTASYTARFLNIAAYVTAPFLTIISWFALYTAMMNSVSPTEESDAVYVRLVTAALLIAVLIAFFAVLGSLASLLFPTVGAQRKIAGTAVVFNLMVIALFYGMLFIASIIPPEGLPRTETNFLLLIAAGCICLLYSFALCYQVWWETSSEEETVSSETTRNSTAILGRETVPADSVTYEE